MRHFGDNVLILWEGEIIQEEDESGSDSDTILIDASTPPSSEDENGEGPIATTVTFKCIGVLRDPDLQQILKEIKQRRDNGEAVLVRLQPEPANAFDSRAILFQAFHLRIWQPCGYVVKEIVEDVHAAIEAQNISSVEFCWVRYKLWKKAPFAV